MHLAAVGREVGGQLAHPAAAADIHEAHQTPEFQRLTRSDVVRVPEILRTLG